LFEFWFFNTHDTCKKLVFETFFCDEEVDDCALSSCLWFVVRIDQLCLQVKLKAMGDFDFFCSEFNELVLASLNKGTGKKGVKDCIDILTNCFNHKNLAG
jgi:hypothetical protein